MQSLPLPCLEPLLEEALSASLFLPAQVLNSFGLSLRITFFCYSPRTKWSARVTELYALVLGEKKKCYDKSSSSKEWHITQQKLLYLLSSLYIDYWFLWLPLVVFCVIPLYWWSTGHRMKAFVIPSVVHQLQPLKHEEDHQLVYKAIDAAAV